MKSYMLKRREFRVPLSIFVKAPKVDDPALELYPEWLKQEAATTGTYVSDHFDAKFPELRKQKSKSPLEPIQEDSEEELDNFIYQQKKHQLNKPRIVQTQEQSDADFKLYSMSISHQLSKQ